MEPPVPVLDAFGRPSASTLRDKAATYQRRCSGVSGRCTTTSVKGGSVTFFCCDAGGSGGRVLT